MKRRDWFLGIAFVVVLVIAAYFLIPQPAVSFIDVEEAWVSINAEGFRCTADCADGRVNNGFLVSREEVKFEEVNNLCKAGAMGTVWKGKVWVSQHTPQQGYNIPDDADARLWGGVYAFGDQELLVELETALQRQRG